MKVAIIGAGFCGLALSYHLLTLSQSHNLDLTITLIDSKGVGNGASGAAAGLVHPYAGKKANLSHNGNEAFLESLTLLKCMDSYSREKLQKPVILQQGILRPAALPEQKNFFYKRSCQDNQFPALYLDEEETKQFYPNPNNIPSLYIPDGLSIDCRQYLDALFHYCSTHESRFSFTQKHVETVDQLKNDGFDVILVAAGYHSEMFFSNHPKMGKVKGQKLDKKLPESFRVPQCGLSGTAYAVFSNSYVCLGSTYEHHYSSLDTDQDAAESEMRQKISLYWPELLDFPTIEITAGVRATTPTSHPIVIYKSPTVWSITGVGSKGLLYHSWLAKTVTHAICKLITIDELEKTLGNTILTKL